MERLCIYSIGVHITRWSQLKLIYFSSTKLCMPHVILFYYCIYYLVSMSTFTVISGQFVEAYYMSAYILLVAMASYCSLYNL